MDDLKSLVERASRGDLEAYGRLVAGLQDMAYGYAYSLTGDFHLAEDATQEAFRAAYFRLGTLRES
ncbi:MAG TPA: sigma factor, partial [Phycisphaerae bacterium]|nr:sigma factor [Phycisphaerae bacterium]